MNRLDPAAILPTEVFHQILGYLDANELAKSTGVSTFWYRRAVDPVLWETHCHSRWQGKRYMRRVFRTGLPATSTLTSGKRLWQYTPEKWKWAYGQAELESQRTSTTDSEIVESYWKFTVPHP
jgi:hypothetical protein